MARRLQPLPGHAFLSRSIFCAVNCCELVLLVGLLDGILLKLISLRELGGLFAN